MIFRRIRHDLHQLPFFFRALIIVSGLRGAGRDGLVLAEVQSLLLPRDGRRRRDDLLVLLVVLLRRHLLFEDLLWRRGVQRQRRHRQRDRRGLLDDFD